MSYVLARSIRIPATYIAKDGFPSTSPGEFNLGLGPCGKVVDTLSVSTQGAFVVIDQVHNDGTGKRFLYPEKSLTGRVEIEVL